jgi:phospholipid transport system substrate-binding protein
MKYFVSLLLGLLVVLSSALAQESAPDALVRKVTDDVLTIVRQDKEIQSGNTRKAIELVDSKVLPYFNFQRMTALAVGRDWSKATPEQKKRLAEEFKTLLVRTYSNALTSYKNQT